MVRSLLRFIRNAASVAVGLVLVLPWLVLSGVGLACLYSADAIERFKDILQDALYCRRMPQRRYSRTSSRPK